MIFRREQLVELPVVQLQRDALRLDQHDHVDMLAAEPSVLWGLSYGVAAAQGKATEKQESPWMVTNV
jgi:hypothetical protein